MTRTSVRLSIVTEWGSCMSALRTARWSRRSEPIMFKYFLENRMNLFLWTIQEDLAFWGIDELSLQACCSLKYYSQISSCQSELEEERTKRAFDVCVKTFLLRWTNNFRIELILITDSYKNHQRLHQRIRGAADDGRRFRWSPPGQGEEDGLELPGVPGDIAGGPGPGLPLPADGQRVQLVLTSANQC